jgi:hypothetical protein
VYAVGSGILVANMRKTPCWRCLFQVKGLCCVRETDKVWREVMYMFRAFEHTCYSNGDELNFVAYIMLE